jgi:hypothetical protein
MASAAVAGTKRSYATMTMSNDITMAMSTALDPCPEPLGSHLRNNISAEETRKSPVSILLDTYPNRLQPQETQAPILLLGTRLHQPH